MESEIIQLPVIEHKTETKKAKIVLVGLYNPQAIGVRIMHRMLENAGHNVTTIMLKHIVDSGGTISEKEYELFLDKIKEIKPDLVCMYLVSQVHETGMTLSMKIKEISNSKILFWGPQPNSKPEECLKRGDIAVLGESEPVIVEVANKVINGEIENIDNVVVKVDGKIRRNKLRPLMHDLNEIPFPDFSDDNKFYIEKDEILSISPFSEHKMVYCIMTSRGCVMNCTFCNSPVYKNMYKGDKTFRRRSPQNVIDELIIAKKEYPTMNKIYFLDDIFIMNYQWVKEFAPLYKKHIDLPFFCYVHPLMVTDMVIKLIAEMGVFEVNMGIQSGSERIRNGIIKRPEKDIEIINSIKIMQKYDIRIVCDFILNNPYEKPEDKRRTVEFISEIPQPIILLTYDMLWFPGTELTKMALSDGFISEDELEGKKKIDPQWHNKFKESYNKEDIYWYALYELAGTGYSKKTMQRLMDNKILKNHPKVMVHYLKTRARLLLVIDSIPKAARYIKKGQWKDLIQKVKLRSKTDW